jgi:2-amino-4-hydroxy-6-hydroxymethyldihydropteridine diphosphokinase
VYLGLGSNVGDRRAHLAAALERLNGHVTIDAISAVYETEPVGFRDQPDFWNLVVRGRTSLAPGALLDALKTVEREAGRTATFTGGPREIDLDILLYDDLVLAEGDIVIPHPRMRERAFVLRPLAELAADLRLPPDGRTVASVLAGGTFEHVRALFPGDDLRPEAT